jgi:nucleoside-diphosphate-sugar epimerase
VNNHNYIIDKDELVLVTGANGFIGSRVIETLLRYGFRNLRCFVRPSGKMEGLKRVITEYPDAKVEILQGNLLSREDCSKAVEGVAVIYHLAAGIDKSFAGAFMNSVVTTRNLLDAVVEKRVLKRIMNVSSFAVYTNVNIKRGGLLDESCAVEDQLVQRYEPYTYGKAKQDELLIEYGRKHHIPYVIVRPGAVYGPGKNAITARVGIGTFGIFLHLGGSNIIPLSYVDNCAEAMVLAGIVPGVDGEVFNIVDDDLPTSREFLQMYKKNVRRFKSIYIPYPLFYFLNYLWERYSTWSEGQLPPVFNRRRCSAYWKGNRYTTQKLKQRLGWTQRVPFADASERYFDYIRKAGDNHA